MPRTLVFFHAHPDDEAIATGGSIARAADDGDRAVIVFATRGELGETEPGFLGADESLTDRRVAEAHEAARILGAARVEFLGYSDSGMAGTDTNDVPGSFWTTPVEAAAAALAAILRAEHADVLTCYDDHGNYGHPDHIQVHRVGVRAAQRAGTPRWYASTVDRDAIRRVGDQFAGQISGFELPDFEAMDLGVPGSMITTRVDVNPWLDVKRAAMAAHASQISETSFFLAMPPDQFAAFFGVESFIRLDRTPDQPETWLVP